MNKVESPIEWEMEMSFVSISFREGNKWRLSDGENTYNVIISDQEFLNKTDNSLISFTKGDLLRVKMVTQQRITGGGELKAEHEIVKILEHRSAARQLPIPFEKS